ncbi:DUF885 domain-containing protein [Sphingomonas sp. URHD0057]|uniref:DUF885 domain-containing protein n=1 Tax=Sphingomonas sp. URHD0057 TaxID=1380389 RepID=UPI00048AEA00|nr:DUF885 family protein [Sphingomonas sp. URHD0057]
MIRTLKWAGPLLMASGSLVPLSAAAAPPPPASQASADARLKALYDGYAAWDAKESGVLQNADGETKPASYLPRIDPATQQRRAAHLQDLLTQLNAIPVAQLSAAEKVNAAVFRTILENAISDARFRLWEMPFNSDSSFWTYLDSSHLNDAAEYRRYIARMRDIPRYFDDQIANMRAGLARGFSVPRATLEGRDASIAAFLADDIGKSPFHKPFDTMPATIPASEQQALRAEGEAAIRDAVQPAYRKLLDFYRSEYLPKARTTLAARDMPDGDAFYRAQIREYTTLDLAPEEIHQIGLKEVARIEAEMGRTMAESGFKGSFQDFLKFLKTDPQFIAKTPDELMGVSSYVAKRTDNVIGNYFGKLPRRRFGIVPVPDALAPFYTSGRGGLENCMMNTYNLPVRPLYNIPALTLHECEPGHSFQAALSEEQKTLPRFRQNLYFSGYGEGWGLYCEWLGNEMGIYRNPYERFGQQSYAMWRAARLVIDTGIHRYDWSRSQAIDYLASHTALSQHEVETEVDRYISWPGQALSYKVGELTIRRLRSEAEAKLGPKFDIKGFHDTFLDMGAVPLSVLEDQMHAWMAAEAAKPPKS